MAQRPNTNHPNTNLDSVDTESDPNANTTVPSSTELIPLNFSSAVNAEQALSESTQSVPIESQQPTPSEIISIDGNPNLQTLLQYQQEQETRNQFLERSLSGSVHLPDGTVTDAHPLRAPMSRSSTIPPPNQQLLARYNSYGSVDPTHRPSNATGYMMYGRNGMPLNGQRQRNNNRKSRLSFPGWNGGFIFVGSESAVSGSSDTRPTESGSDEKVNTGNENGQGLRSLVDEHTGFYAANSNDEKRNMDITVSEPQHIQSPHNLIPFVRQLIDDNRVLTQMVIGR